MIEKNTYFHLSFKDNLANSVIFPKIPDCVKDENQYDLNLEDNIVPRFCMAPDITKCLNSISHLFSLFEHYPYLTLYVYTNKKKIVNYTSSHEIHIKRLVFDAYATKEIWVHENIEVSLLGYFNIYPTSLKNKLKVKIFNQENNVHSHFFHYTYQKIPSINDLIL